jgi:transposase InsO family protein
MIRPFKKAHRGYTHILVVIDIFTKLIGYKPIASLTSAKAVEFIQDIIFRFGIPNNIITDLGSNSTSAEFFDFYEQRSIQIRYALVAHLRANGQVERANRMILEALRKKVLDKSEKLAGKWIRELLYVMWSLRTQPSRALHGNTPFFMVYGSEAVESRLEGVDRRNLKIINLTTHYKPGLALERISSPGERGKQIK